MYYPGPIAVDYHQDNYVKQEYAGAQGDIVYWAEGGGNGNGRLPGVYEQLE